MATSPPDVSIAAPSPSSPQETLPGLDSGTSSPGSADGPSPCVSPGFPDTADVWTGSCPCQGLSDAGKGLAALDPRHLWPAWFALIDKCRPAILFGEQVASGLGLEWLDLVFTDLERCGYAVGAADLCAASVGAPHQRQRLFFVAYTPFDRRLQGLYPQLPERRPDADLPQADRGGKAGQLADAHGEQRDRRRREGRRIPEPTDRGAHGGVADTPGERGGRRRQRAAPRRPPLEPARRGLHGRMADPDGPGREVVRQQQARRQRATPERGGEAVVMGDPDGIGAGRDTGSLPGSEGQQPGPGHLHRRVSDGPVPAGATRGFWADAEWIFCRSIDGGPPVARPVEPGTFPLAARIPGRVGLIAGYGNAIVPQVAAVFIRASLAAIAQTLTTATPVER